MASNSLNLSYTASDSSLRDSSLRESSFRDTSSCSSPTSSISEDPFFCRDEDDSRNLAAELAGTDYWREDFLDAEDFEDSSDPFADVEYECEVFDAEETRGLLARMYEENEDAISPVLPGLTGRAAQEHNRDAEDYDEDLPNDDASPFLDPIQANHTGESSRSNSTLPPPYKEHPILFSVPREHFPGGVQEVEHILNLYLELRAEDDGGSSMNSASSGRPSSPESHIEDPRRVPGPYRYTRLINAALSSQDDLPVEEPRRKLWSWRGVRGKMGVKKEGRLRSLFGRRRGRGADNLMELAERLP